jgi:long-chain acyl-CoA synthetase
MIAERLEQTAARFPDSIALVDGDTRISYLELTWRVTAFARYLKQDLALTPGEAVGFFLPNCWQFVVGFFAVAKIGAVCMPFNTRWRASELEPYVRRFPVSAIVTSQELREPWDRLGELIPPERVLVIEKPEVAEALAPESSAQADWRGHQSAEKGIALNLMTSGSTGRPRVAPRSHRAMLAGATNVGQAVGVRAGQRFLAVVPFYHSNGLNNCMFLPLMHGATIVVMKKFEPRRFADLVRTNKIQVLIVSPFILRVLGDQNLDADAFSSVEVCLSSGAPTPRALAELWQDRFAIRVRQLYGSPETGTISIEPADAPIRGGSVGTPVPCVEVRVLDSAGGERALGEVGEIVIRSPSMMPGYVGEPELNARVFTGGYFRTGDVGKLDEDDNLSIVGRKKRTINFGGIQVGPGEIEAVIEKMPGIRGCRVLGVMDRRQSEIIKAVVVVGDEHGRSRRDVVEHCRRFLAEYKIPRVIDFVNAIPMDLTGKQWMTLGSSSDELSSTQNETTAAD